MRPLTLILVFLPLIVFSVLARLLPASLVGVAALAAVATVLMTALAPPAIWPPKALPAICLTLFVLIAVLGFGLGRGGDSWLATWGAPGVGLAVGLVILA